MAKAAGIPRRHISEMENNKRPIGKQNARKLAEVLNVDRGQYLMNEDNRQYYNSIADKLFDIVEKHLGDRAGWSDERIITSVKFRIATIIDSCIIENNEHISYSQYMKKMQRCLYLCSELDEIMFCDKRQEFAQNETFEFLCRTNLIDMIDMNLLKYNMMVMKSSFELAIATKTKDNYFRKLKKFHVVVDNLGMIFGSIDFNIEDVWWPDKIKSELGPSNCAGHFYCF